MTQISKVRKNTGVFDAGFTAQAVQPGAGVLGIFAEQKPGSATPPLRSVRRDDDRGRRSQRYSRRPKLFRNSTWKGQGSGNNNGYEDDGYQYELDAFNELKEKINLVNNISK